MQAGPIMQTAPVTITILREVISDVEKRLWYHGAR